jgi:hypothetical protein
MEFTFLKNSRKNSKSSGKKSASVAVCLQSNPTTKKKQSKNIKMKKFTLSELLIIVVCIVCIFVSEYIFLFKIIMKKLFSSACGLQLFWDY